MLNRVFLKGNLGRAPEVGLTQDGRVVAKFFLATNTPWKACARPRENGEHEEPGESCTEWHQIRVFRESTVRWIKDKLKKGDTVYVEGKLSYHHWTDTYGKLRLTAYIVISNWDGRVEYLRSSNAGQEETPGVANDSQRPPLKVLTHEPAYTKSGKQPLDSPNEESLSTQQQEKNNE